MNPWLNPVLREDFESQARSLAKGILDEREELVTNSRRMHDLLTELGVPSEDPALQTFAAIVVDSAHLPMGKQREFWDAAALEVKDAQIAELEAYWTAQGCEACKAIAARFARPPVPPDDSPLNESSLW